MLITLTIINIMDSFLPKSQFVSGKSFIHNVYRILWAGYRSRYNDWLRTGSFGDRILMGVKFSICGPGSVVGIGTVYGLDSSGIESWWGWNFPHLSGPALGHTQSPVQWVPGLSQEVTSSRGVTLTSHPLLVPWSRKSRAMPLLSLWAVRPVQRPCACTRVHFTVFTLHMILRIVYMVKQESYKSLNSKICFCLLRFWNYSFS
jgi:hypothetical protein